MISDLDDDYFDDDWDDIDGCLHGIPWNEECWQCDEYDDEYDEETDGLP